MTINPCKVCSFIILSVCLGDCCSLKNGPHNHLCLAAIYPTLIKKKQTNNKKTLGKRKQCYFKACIVQVWWAGRIFCTSIYRWNSFAALNVPRDAEGCAGCGYEHTQTRGGQGERSSSRLGIGIRACGYAATRCKGCQEFLAGGSICLSARWLGDWPS